MKASTPNIELRGSSARYEGDITSHVTMSLAEAAGALGVHRTTAWSLHKRGAFPVPVLKVGSNLRVVKAHLQQFLDTGEPVMAGSLRVSSGPTSS